MTPRRAAGFILLLLLFAGGSAASEALPSSTIIDPAVVQRLESDMPILDLTRDARPLPADMRTFYEAYGLYHPRVRNFYGRFDVGDYKISAYVFVPEAVRGTVYCLHGYFDHVGILQHLVSAFLERNYAVAALDLPGHGLSSGDPGEVEDFGDYAAVLDEFVRRSRPYLTGPYHLVGHSMGGAVVLEFIYSRPIQAGRFKKVVLAAPLIRHAFYQLSRVQVFLLDPFFESFPRRFHANSNDPAFVEHIKHDPLEGQRVPFGWLNALYRWNDRFADYPPYPGAVLVVQGTDDDVLDWDYNMDALEKKLTQGRIRLIEGARHQLFNESASLRRQVLNDVVSFLEP
jgi:lysophospholipase